jgi:hypothetical protein
LEALRKSAKQEPAFLCDLEGTKMEKAFRKTGKVMNVPLYFVDNENTLW